MPTAPTPVAFSVVAAATGASITSASLTLAVGDVVVFGSEGEGGTVGNTYNAPSTTLTVSGGSITQLQLHAASSDCEGGLWTFTVGSGTTTGTVTVNPSNSATRHNLFVGVWRNGTQPTVGRSTISTGSGRTVSYTPSQADSAILWMQADWAAAAVQSATPTPTTHTAGSPGPSAVPQSALVTGFYTWYASELDDQTSAGAVSYGIGGTGTGPFTILVAEIQGTGGAVATPPELVMAFRQF